MAEFKEIKDVINANIKTNGKQAITGKVLNSTLIGMVDSVDAAISEEVRMLDESIEGKVSKETGKGLSSNDFTNALKEKLQGLTNYDDAEVKAAIEKLRGDFDTLVAGDTSAAIKSFNDIVAFLEGIEDSESLDSIIASIEQQIAGKQDVISDLETIRQGAAKGATALQRVPSDYATKSYVDNRVESYVNTLVETALLTTWEDLVDLRNYASLKPGQFYRIIDYVTTTTQENTQSAEHRFDVIVLALNEYTLSEEAYAVYNDEDSYFVDAGANLSAWKIWYCLDNNQERFSWADEENGRGVIYRMIDEWGNDCPYDFKNIMFVRYELEAPDEADSDDAWVRYFSDNLQVGFADSMSFRWGGLEDGDRIWEEMEGVLTSFCTGENLAFFTFSVLDDNNNVLDHSLSGYVRQNRMSPYRDGLNNNIFVTDSNNTETLYNFFGFNCHGNTIGFNSVSNRFEDNCYGNILGTDATNNVFECECYNNILSHDTGGNLLRKKCYYNSIGSGSYDNVFGRYSNHNALLYSCESNEFGEYCECNGYGSQSSGNRFGHYCRYNSGGVSCSYNIFGNQVIMVRFEERGTGSHFSYNTFGSGIQNLLMEEDSASGNPEGLEVQFYRIIGPALQRHMYVERDRRYETVVAMTSDGEWMEGVIANFF